MKKILRILRTLIKLKKNTIKLKMKKKRQTLSSTHIFLTQTYYLFVSYSFLM